MSTVNADRAVAARETQFAELCEFRRAVTTPAGRTIMEHLRKITGADKSCYRPGDATATAFVCGLRDAYLLMRRDAEIDLDALARKLKLTTPTGEES